MATRPAPSMRSNGLLRVVGNDELRDNERIEDEKEQMMREPMILSLVHHVRKNWQRAQEAKNDIERIMLRGLRQRVGRYDPNKWNEIRKFGGSGVYMRQTDQKCRAVGSWIMDIMRQGRPWDLDATPIADVPASRAQFEYGRVYQQVYQEAEAMLMSGMVVDVAAFREELRSRLEAGMDVAKQELQDEADERVDKMAEVIEDQLEEADFDHELRMAICEDLLTYGTCVIKGPVYRRLPRLRWDVDFETDEVTAIEEDEVIPVVERVNPLDLYPSDDSMDTKGSYIIERIRSCRGDIAAMRGTPGYNDSAIDAVLDEYGRGGLREWTDIESERRHLEERDDWWQASYSDRIDILAYHGKVQGRMMLEWDNSLAGQVDELEEYEVEAWLIGNWIIRAVINEEPTGARPYCRAVYADRPGSFWGIGIPELMKDIQEQINAVARALANNVSLASGPMVAIEREKMMPQEDGTEIRPWKVYEFKQAYSGGAANGVLPIQFFQPEMNGRELMEIYEKWTEIADDITGIPRYMGGVGERTGPASTASGLAMMMNAASKQLRQVVANIDDGLIKPMIERFYTMNMMYNPDSSIKGDAQVVAKGVSGLLVKEQMQMRRNEFLQAVNNPVDVEIMGQANRAELLREAGRALDLDPDDVAPSKEEMEEMQQQAQAMAAAGGMGAPGQSALPVPQLEAAAGAGQGQAALPSANLNPDGSPAGMSPAAQFTQQPRPGV